MEAILTRQKHEEKQTLGQLEFSRGPLTFRCKTLELPWKDNKRNISCIPTGTYKVKKHFSASHALCFSILNVPNRTHILIHAGNKYSEIRGCILVGASFGDIDGDGVIDVRNSRQTLKEFLDAATEEFELEIKNE